MTTSLAVLEDAIANEKAELMQNLAALEVRTRELADWRWQVRRHPLAAVGVAAAGGVLLAMLAGRGGRRRPRGSDEDRGPSLLSHPIVDRLVGAAGVVLAERVSALISDLLPDGSAPRKPRSNGDAG